ncbi:glycosyltransferase [Providencia hangzhouensis]|uniref:glycosyltransferase n=1 Tax=Providencia hangzhouensis TaxID=3031799 RepID=UPI0034DCFFAF
MLNVNVAVIMSVYKGDSLENISIAVDSILNQNFTNLKLFIYVDGEISTEVKSYLDSLIYKGCFVHFSPKNNGLAVGLNYLIDEVVSQCDFRYIARMDSDDISYENRILKQVKFLESNLDIDLCGTFCREFGSSFALNVKSLPISHPELERFSATRCPFIHPTVMFRTSVFQDGVRYPTDTSFTEDMALWFSLLDNGYKFSNLPEVLLDYRLEESTLTRRLGINKAKSEFFLRNKYMWKLNNFSIYNVFAIYARFIFHLLPEAGLKLVYKNLR